MITQETLNRRLEMLYSDGNTSISNTTPGSNTTPEGINDSFEQLKREYIHVFSYFVHEPHRFEDPELIEGYFTMSRIFRKLGIAIEDDPSEQELQILGRILVMLSLEIGAICNLYTTIKDLADNFRVEEICYDTQGAALTFDLMYEFFR